MQRYTVYKRMIFNNTPDNLENGTSKSINNHYTGESMHVWAPAYLTTAASGENDTTLIHIYIKMYR